MKQLFAFHVSLRGAGLTLAVAACLALGLASSPAGAEQCARGQIFWKSKKTCVDKAEAAKLGFYHGPVPAQNKTGDKAEPETPAAEEPAAAAVTPPEPDPAAVQPAAAIAPKPSPYGELVLEEFAKAK
ncbi:hypothetical protein QM467_14855 [Rhodoblastus sp. 17X3]|uniref:hypothetical protein n=1 Tax=Rhodoblastus sp. 17X3 TaxID=3047026 RepID=UPI0024B66AE9|nr:hypothetical protein [Rhodoblastus sp. 17X3]MDI9849335.1 hypothetical protein [Rhodoblastus sp. 17X3]